MERACWSISRLQAVRKALVGEVGPGRRWCQLPVTIPSKGVAGQQIIVEMACEVERSKFIPFGRWHIRSKV